MRRRIRYVFGLISAAVLCEIIYLFKWRDGSKDLQETWKNQLVFIRNVAGTRTVTLEVTGTRSNSNSCSDVFPGMLHGRWEPQQNVSAARRKEMDAYLARCRDEFRIPRTLQRNDGKCGNLPYDGIPLYSFMWFRSVCNPLGPTPCCYNFRCASDREAGNCTCPTCIDSRLPVHAELSRWVPAKAECQPREFSSREACELLRGTTLLLAGDSFVRHAFVALVILLTDNYKDGAIKKSAPAGLRTMCQGMFQINGLRCRDILDQNRTLCGGSVNAIYLEIFRASAGIFLVPHVKKLVAQNKNVLVMLGAGIHDNFRQDIVWSMLLKPVVEYFTNSTIPSFINDLPWVPWIDLILKKNKPGLGHNVLLSQKLNGSSSTKSSSSQRIQANTSEFSSSSNGRNRTWPKLVWASTHAPGLLKTPKVPAQSFEGVKYYNEEIARRLEPLGIPILDSFNMTQPLHAVDGTHYGYRANMLKVQFLLNWVKERQDRGEWW